MVFLALKVIGYYGHYNFGDEQYKLSIKSIFQEYITDIIYSIDFIDCDHISEYCFLQDDIIIIGGGDILNSYFMDKINKTFKDKSNIIIGLSVGLPYTSVLIDSSKLKIIDYIFLRTTVDIDIFKRYFYDDRIFYIPDLSYVLTKGYTFTKYLIDKHTDILESDDDMELKKYSKFIKTCKNEQIYILTEQYLQYKQKINDVKKTRKIMGICLSRHFYNKQYLNEYNNVVNGLISFIKGMIIEKYHIVFIPFNTSTINTNENDIVFANDIVNLLDQGDFTNINITLNHDEMNDVICMLDICIPMRFHSVLYCIYNLIPFVSVYSTRKIHNLLDEIDWDFTYKLQLNEKLVPIDLNSDILKDTVNNLINFCEIRQNIYHKLLHININFFGTMFFKNIQKLIDVICLKKTSKNFKVGFDYSNIDNMIENTYDTVINYANSQGYDYYRDIDNVHKQTILASIISYNLIGLIDSEYNYGMREKIFNKTIDYNHIKEWKWIINDYVNKRRRKLSNNPNGFFNMDYIDQIDYSGAHRSGWQYVYEHIEYLHNSESDVLLDLYIDRTFHWN